MRLELGIMAGAESKAFLADLTKQIDRLERLTKGKGLNVTEEDEDEALEANASEAEEEVEEDDDFAVPAKKKAAKKTAAAFDDEEDEEDQEEEEEEIPAKKTRAKKVTIDDVNDACKERVAREGGGKKGRTAVLALLKKKFGTETISEIEPEKYQALVKLMQG